MAAVRALPGLGPDYISKFFRGDGVIRNGDESRRYVVLRCWADEDMPDLPPGAVARPEDRPLLKGEVGISSVNPLEQLIVPESTLSLWSRRIERGEIVKKSLTNPEAAVVLDVHNEVQVEHVITGQKITEWIPEDLFVPTIPFMRGDRVIYQNWIGTIDTVLEVAKAWSPSGDTYTLNDWNGLHQIGRSLADLRQARIDTGLDIALPQTVFDDQESHDARLVRVAPLAAKVQWNAINQELDNRQQQNNPKPPETLSATELVRMSRQLRGSDQVAGVGAIVEFRHTRDARRYKLKPSKHEPVTDALWAVKVTRVRSKAKLQWQDGSITEEWTTDIVLHERADDDDCWPGDHVRWSDDDGKQRNAIVQAADSHERTLDLLLLDTQEKQTVSVLELAPGDDSEGPCGVDIGTEVILCADNLSGSPFVPGIGQNHRQPDPHEEDRWANSLLMYLSIENLDMRGGTDWASASLNHAGVNWHGYVVGLELDGRVNVRVTSGKTVTLELKNLYALMPTTIDGLSEFDDDYSDTSDFQYTFVNSGGNPFPHAHGHQHPHYHDHLHAHQYNPFLHPLAPLRPSAPSNGHDSDCSWQTTDDEWDGSEIEDVDMDGAEPQSKEPASNEPDEETMSEEARDIEMVEPMTAPSPVRHSVSPAAPSVPLPRAGPSRIPEQPSLRGSEHWIHFDVLESVPQDHHFYSQKAAGANRSRVSRLNKEHKALRNSLPENIIVRSYEDRMDLMRVMIMGPEGTPYGAAPFVFDVYLHGNYPFEPPVVHFHSHTNGKGRCNPNLYEDGKVCLSILGTWAGDASESWNPEKSSLLQVFVSISGLVLVRSPYHCEPAFAKLEGTKEGLINSRQYSEKAYVLSRAFIRQALLHPPSSLETELKHYYLSAGRLKSVIDHARTLMDKESDPSDEDEGGERWNADAIGSLTKGAKLSLRRTIEKLEELWVEHRASSV